jgi:hypothetical protein
MSQKRDMGLPKAPKRCGPPGSVRTAYPLMFFHSREDFHSAVVPLNSPVRKIGPAYAPRLRHLQQARLTKRREIMRLCELLSSQALITGSVLRADQAAVTRFPSWARLPLPGRLQQ